MHPYFLISQLGCVKPAEVPQSSEPPQEQSGSEEAQTTEDPTEAQEEQIVIRTSNPPPPKLPPPKEERLPAWDEIEAPEHMPKPTSGLALSSDGQLCFKEFFGERTVHPHVRRYGGRILMPDEQAQGPQIQCPAEKRSALIQQLKEAQELPENFE